MEAKHTKHEPNPNFSYVFPAIRGVQAGREYYVSMCPLRLLPKLFQFDDEEMHARVVRQPVTPDELAAMTLALENCACGAIHDGDSEDG